MYDESGVGVSWSREDDCWRIKEISSLFNSYVTCGPKKRKKRFFSLHSDYQIRDMVEIGKDFFDLKRKHKEFKRIDEKKKKSFLNGANAQINERLGKALDCFYEYEKKDKNTECILAKETILSMAALRKTLTKMELEKRLK